MNFVFISPNFPVRYYKWAEALKDHGITVLGIGDSPLYDVHPRLLNALTEYYFVKDLSNIEDLKKADYMQNHVGEIYDGTVTGVTNFGVFVEFPNTVEGMCSIENLPTDNYVFLEKLYKLAGSKHDYQLGQKVRVQVESVNLRRRQINLKMLEK